MPTRLRGFSSPGAPSSSQESYDGVSDCCGCLALREMTDAIEHDALVPRAEEALLPLGSGGVVARIAAAVDDQGRNADGRVPRKLRFQIGVSGILRRQPPPDAVGVQHDLRPVRIVE